MRTPNIVQRALERFGPRMTVAECIAAGTPPDMPGMIASSIPHIRCVDGFTFSVQVGSALYCAPRSGAGPWHQVEVGFPSAREEMLMPYIDGNENTDPTKTVYGYVPLEVVEAIVEAHGGISGVVSSSRVKRARG